MLKVPSVEPSDHFPRLPKRDRGLYGDRWIWLSRCRRFRVVNGVLPSPRLAASTWWVEKLIQPNQRQPWGSWAVVSRHGLGSEAFRAAEELWNSLTPDPCPLTLRLRWFSNSFAGSSRRGPPH